MLESHKKNTDTHAHLHSYANTESEKITKSGKREKGRFAARSRKKNGRWQRGSRPGLEFRDAAAWRIAPSVRRTRLFN